MTAETGAQHRQILSEFTGTAWVIVFTLSLIALFVVYLGCYLSSDWNDIRLAPTFMWWHHADPYPGPGEGPITTWIYGPAPLLVYSPAVLASNAFAALALAFGINFILAAAPLFAVVAIISRSDDGLTRAKALLLGSAAWPACNLIYQQADNTAVFFGLMALGLFSTTTMPGRRMLWLAAVAGGLALWSKPNEMGPVLGQIVLVALRGGKVAALRQTLRVAVAAGLSGILFILAFGADGLIYNMFVVPSRIPWDDVVGKVCLATIPAYISAYVLIPLLIVMRRGKALLMEPSPMQAAAWFFILSLPFNVSGFAIVGGNLNSLHACAYLIPALALLMARVRSWVAPSIVMIGLLGFQLMQMPAILQGSSPRAARESLRHAERLAEACKGQIYFPWNPLLTFYSEKTFYHVEDGIFARTLSGETFNQRLHREGLPKAMSWIAHRSGLRGMYAEELLPDTKVYYAFNNWTLISGNGLLPASFSPIPSTDTPTPPP